MKSSPAAHPTAEQTRTLVRVVLDLADDFGFPCAVVVVDGDGRLLSAERAPGLPAIVLEEAVARAREAIATLAPAGAVVGAGLPLGDEGGLAGAIGVGGGPVGFAAEAVIVAAAAAKLGRFAAGTPTPCARSPESRAPGAGRSR